MLPLPLTRTLGSRETDLSADVLWASSPGPTWSRSLKASSKLQRASLSPHGVAPWTHTTAQPRPSSGHSVSPTCPLITLLVRSPRCGFLPPAIPTAFS